LKFFLHSGNSWDFGWDDAQNSVKLSYNCTKCGLELIVKIRL